MSRGEALKPVGGFCEPLESSAAHCKTLRLTENSVALRKLRWTIEKFCRPLEGSVVLRKALCGAEELSRARKDSENGRKSLRHVPRFCGARSSSRQRQLRNHPTLRPVRYPDRSSVRFCHFAHEIQAQAGALLSGVGAA